MVQIFIIADLQKNSCILQKVIRIKIFRELIFPIVLLLGIAIFPVKTLLTLSLAFLNWIMQILQML
ncbi:MAG: hypothetical protein BHW65_07690 [Verrucomicrobia bacterium CAG:312_58_20]|nr:MAG: hypothetical protein BHW65_07690 [Verrucomicrobia bacterium CAG:312_58_20]